MKAIPPDIEKIWSEFSERLGAFIRGRVEDPATAEDILQDVFLKLQQRLDEFRDAAKVQGWLFLVARNAIIDHYRARKKTSELAASLPAEPLENNTEAEELNEVFQKLVRGLPEPYREALVLADLEGLSQEQLAKRAGISLSGAKSRVQRGRELLKERLLDYCHREFAKAADAQPCPKGLLPLAGSAKPAAQARPKSKQNKKSS